MSPTLPRSGVPKIPNDLALDKDGSGLRRLLMPLGLATVLVSWATGVAAVPVQIGWQLPLSKDEAYQLEVARDAGFGDIAHTAEVKGGTAFAWDTPGEGIYHWRLARPGQKGQGGEVITFVSGSFAAIDVDAARFRPARLSWAAEDGADSYKLYVVDGEGRARTMISTSPTFVVPQSDRSLMIEVVPFSGAQRLFNHYHFNPTLVLDSGLPPEPVVESTPAPLATAEPVPTPPPAAEPLQVAEAVTEAAARPRMHLTHAFVFAGTEELKLQKREVALVDLGKVQGLGAGVWTNPVSGLVVQGQAMYHEHEADLTQEAILPGIQVPLFAARYTAELGIGWDVLSSLKSRWHRLVLSFNAMGTQLPFLPLAFAGNPPTKPDVEKKAITLLGGSAAYGYFGDQVAGIAEAGLTMDETDDAQAAYQRLVVEIYVGERTALHVGALNRLTTSGRCHTDHEICLSYGKSRTTSKEVYGTIGVGVVFR